MSIEQTRIREEMEDLVELAEEKAKKSMKVLSEFKEFAVKGNVVDMAVGVIIGAAFGTIAKSLVDDIIMPPISVLLNGVDFKQRFVVIKAAANGVKDFATLDAAQKAGAVTLNYGNFINNILTFVIVAFAVFLLVRMVNRLRREEQVEPTTPTDKTCDFCATAIPILAKRCPHCTSELSTA